MSNMGVFGQLITAFLFATIAGQQASVIGAEELSGPKPMPGLVRAPSRVKVGEGAQFTIGGFDIASADELPGVLKTFRRELPRMKAAGVTSHETYVRWNLVETSPGKFDFSL